MLETKETIRFKAERRIEVNRTLLGISLSLFVFIIALNYEILKDNLILALGLTLAIPLLLSSTFARIKEVNSKKPIVWDRFAFISFILGYSFLISVVGILLSFFVSLKIGMIFFTLNILMALIHSVLEVIEDRSKLNKRIIKETIFALLIIIFGVLPSLRVYSI